MQCHAATVIHPSEEEVRLVRAVPVPLQCRLGCAGSVQPLVDRSASGLTAWVEPLKQSSLMQCLIGCRPIRLQFTYRLLATSEQKTLTVYN